VRDSGGDDHRVRAAKLRLLTSTELTVSVGYSELQHGTELTGEQIAELIATRPRRARQSREEDRPAARSPEMEAVTPALDAATGAKLGGDALLTEDTASDDESADDTVTVKHARPRRRIREMSPTDEVATDGRADDA